MNKSPIHFFGAGLVFLLGACSAVSPTPSISPASIANRSPHAVASILVQLAPSLPTNAIARKVRRVVVSFVGNRGKAVSIPYDNGNCGQTSCEGTLAVPSAVHVFSVDTYDKSGKKLARAWIYDGLGEGTLELTLTSTVEYANIVADEPFPRFGQRAIVHLYVSVTGVDDVHIVAPGPYSRPIVLATSKGLPGMRLSTTVLRTPADAVPTLEYAGGYTSTAVWAKAYGPVGAALVVPLLRSPKAIPVRSSGGSSFSYGIASSNEDVWATAETTALHVDATDDSARAIQTSNKGWAAGQIAVAPDGTLWYGACNPDASGLDPGIGSLSPGGHGTFFSMTAAICGGLAWGPDGNLWFAQPGGISKMSPQGVVSVVAHAPVPSQTANMVFAPDGTIWTIRQYTRVGGRLLHFSQTGALLGEYGNFFTSVAIDGAGRILAFGEKSFTAFDASGNVLAKYLPFIPPGEYPVFSQAALAKDGSLWFGINPDNPGFPYYLGRVDTKGQFTEMALPPVQGRFVGLTATQDGSLWYFTSSPASPDEMFRFTPPSAP